MTYNMNYILKSIKIYILTRIDNINYFIELELKWTMIELEQVLFNTFNSNDVECVLVYVLSFC